MAYTFGILKNEVEDSTIRWIEACEVHKVNYKVIDFTKNDWMEKVSDESIDCFLVRSPGDTSVFKKLYDERLYVLSKILGKKIYPTFEEVFVHENKIALSYWLQANKIPHPKTDVFYYEEEAFDFLKNHSFPIVGKTNIGSAGEGVIILKNLSKAETYVKKAFSSGIKRRFGPNLKQGNIKARVKMNILDFKDFKKKVERYLARFRDTQKDFVIFQEFIPHDYEWRMVRIGDSYFGHKKMKLGEMASGTKVKGFERPQDSLLDFTKDACDKRGFLSQAVDIFENSKGGYLVNEMQTFFGQVYPFQMKIGEKIGRFRLLEGKWVFEEGDFNGHECFDLRLEHAIKLLDENNTKLFYN